MRRIIGISWLLCMCLAVVACVEDGTGGAPDKTIEDDGKPLGKDDAWNRANDPRRFEIQFDYKYETLKGYTEGRAEQIPWPSDYWATYQDSTNVRYLGSNTLSPMEKFDKAFNSWTPTEGVLPLDMSSDCGANDLLENKRNDYYGQLGPAAKWQHENKGHYRARDGVDNDNDGKIDECRGEDYDGVETWWGLCHAWVPAAILEPEPLKPVTINGVEFTVSDIKALLITSYDRNSALMLGGRCNAKELARDKDTGRLTAEECRDTNAGAFYVVITNMLGIRKRAFAEDRTAGYQVWNQPVLSYRILSERTLTEAEAIGLVKGKTTDYNTEFNSPDATDWRYVKMDVDYIGESSSTEDGPLTPNISRYTHTDHYELIVELDRNGLVVGGEWLNYSQETHPDFLWLPIRQSAGNPYVSFSKVKQLLELSRKEDAAPTTTGDLRSFGGTVSVAIPDNNRTGAKSTLSVTDDIQIAGLKVELDIEHSYIGDLTVTLEKGGKTVTLHDKQGAGNDNIVESFEVADFNGTSTKGTWTLKVVDSAARDVGTIKKFALNVATGSVAAQRTIKKTSTTAVSVLDENPTGIVSTIKVTEEGAIKSVKLTVDITHTYIGDLIVSLEHDGQSQMVTSHEGGSADNIHKTYTYTSFNGSPVKGDWKLSVKDDVGGDVGTLDGWTIEFSL